MIRGSGLNRKTLKKIPYYPEPLELYNNLDKSKGWPYKINKDRYMIRDKCLIALTYILGLRISETLRLTKEQFFFHEKYIEVRSIELSKFYISKVKKKQRKNKYRIGFIFLTKERSIFTHFITDYLNIVKEGKLFKFGKVRAYQIFESYFPQFTCHWFRAFCENYLYSTWDHDLLAVADYIGVDSPILQQYIRRGYEKYIKI
jgi:integrase